MCFLFNEPRTLVFEINTHNEEYFEIFQNFSKISSRETEFSNGQPRVRKILRNIFLVALKSI